MSGANGSNGTTVVDATALRRLTVGDILAANDIVEEDVEVPEWGGTVHIRAFTKARQQDLRRMATDPRSGQIDSEKLELQIFTHGVIDPQFEPVQATELRGKSAGAIDRVIKRIMAISGMTEDAVEAAKKSVQE